MPFISSLFKSGCINVLHPYHITNVPGMIVFSFMFSFMFSRALQEKEVNQALR